MTKLRWRKDEVHYTVALAVVFLFLLGVFAEFAWALRGAMDYRERMMIQLEEHLK